MLLQEPTLDIAHQVLLAQANPMDRSEAKKESTIMGHLTSEPFHLSSKSTAPILTKEPEEETTPSRLQLRLCIFMRTPLGGANVVHAVISTKHSCTSSERIIDTKKLSRGQNIPSTSHKDELCCSLSGKAAQLNMTDPIYVTLVKGPRHDDPCMMK